MCFWEEKARPCELYRGGSADSEGVGTSSAVEPGSVKVSHSWDEVSDGGPDRAAFVDSSSSPEPTSFFEGSLAAVSSGGAGLASAAVVEGSLTSRLVISITILKTFSGTVFW